jgi:glyoxylase-like metal-dependent hydrolase (beta-lactamase superfamily II)
MDSVERVPIPTPFGIGRVNCYVFTGDGLALLDPGPKTDEAYAALASGLDDLGHAVADIDRILISHAHLDHYGLASRVAAESGAAVLAHEHAVDPLADPDAHFAREQAFFRPFLASMGVPEELVDTVVELPEPYTDFWEAVEVDRALGEGDTVDVGTALEVVHTPGHTPDSITLVAAAESTAFTGDHVMLEVSPNPLLTVRPEQAEERTRSLPDYLDSLATVQSLGPMVGHAGHRDPIADVGERAAAIIDHHHERKEAIAEMIDDAGEATAYSLTKRLFPDLPVTEMFPGMSEIVGHLDLLEDEGRVTTTTRDGVRLYRPD